MEYSWVWVVFGIIFVCLWVCWSWRRTRPPVIDKIYYINLNRRPDRQQHMLDQLKSERIPSEKVVRFRAIDGKTHQFTPEELAMFKNADFKHEANKNMLMGNQLSHYYILRDIVDKKYPCALILQDDVVFKKGFLRHLGDVLKHMPNDAEMVNIGFHEYAVHDVFVPIKLEDPGQNRTKCEKPVNDYVCKLDNMTNPCSLAFIVTLQGAKNLLEHFQKVGFSRATDWNYNEYLQSKDIFYGSKTALCTGAPLGSNIFGPSSA